MVKFVSVHTSNLAIPVRGRGGASTRFPPPNETALKGPGWFVLCTPSGVGRVVVFDACICDVDPNTEATACAFGSKEGGVFACECGIHCVNAGRTRG